MRLQGSLQAIVQQFGGAEESPVVKVLAVASERALRAHRMAFLARVDQAQALDDGPWEIEPHLTIALKLDLMHDEYTAYASRARLRFNHLNEAIVAVLQGLQPKATTAEGGQTASAALPDRKAALVKANTLLGPSQKIVDELVPLVRAPYNRREIGLTTRFGLGNEREMLDVLREFVRPDQIEFEVARNFAEGRNLSISPAPSPADSKAGSKQGSKGSRTGASSDDSGSFSTRELCADLVDRLAQQLKSVSSAVWSTAAHGSAAQGSAAQGSAASESQALVQQAFRQGVLAIQTFALVSDPHRELKIIWQGEFLRSVGKAFGALDDVQKELVGPIFAAQARALGLLSQAPAK